MTKDQYTDLVDFLSRKFDAIDRRFDDMDRRLTALEVSHEAMRDDIRALAEGQAAMSALFDRFEAERQQRFDGIDPARCGVASRVPCCARIRSPCA
jgi:hypothetical protein